MMLDGQQLLPVVVSVVSKPLSHPVVDIGKHFPSSLVTRPPLSDPDTSADGLAEREGESFDMMTLRFVLREVYPPLRSVSYSNLVNPDTSLIRVRKDRFGACVHWLG